MSVHNRAAGDLNLCTAAVVLHFAPGSQNRAYYGTGENAASSPARKPPRAAQLPVIEFCNYFETHEPSRASIYTETTTMRWFKWSSRRCCTAVPPAVFAVCSMDMSKTMKHK